MASRTLTGRSRRAEQRIQSLMLDRLTIQYQRRIAREISRAMRAAATDPNNPLHLAIVQNDHQSRLKRLIADLHTAAVRSMAGHILGVEKSVKSLTAVRPTILIDSVMELFTREYGSELITGIISRTTINDIKTMVEIGIAQGKSEAELTQMIINVAQTKSASRAQTIARTETHAAANWAARESALSVGIDMEREWVAAQNERTRLTHAEADGQRRGMNEPFQVGDALLMYPGEYTGLHPEETINCRCAVVYVFD